MWHRLWALFVSERRVPAPESENECVGTTPVDPLDGELDLHAFRAKETADLVREYVLACQAKGVLALRIVHGKGKGVQRRIVHATLEEQPIKIFINSPGGHVESGDSIYDVVRFIAPEVFAIGSGWVASAGALVFAACARHRRFALPNTRFMLHEPSGGIRGQAADIEIEARQVLLMRARLNAIFAQATGQSEAKIAQDTERNHWMTASEAVGYGLVGKIVQNSRELDSPAAA